MDPTITAPPSLERRQLWGASTYSPSENYSYHCTNITLPPGGTLILPSRTYVLRSSALYIPQCTDGMTNFSLVNATGMVIQGSDESFYSSATVIIFVIAVATVIGWMLLIIPLSSPTVLNNAGRATRNSLFPSNGLFARLTSGATIFSTGNRPALQKIAAVIVTTALTLATAKMFNVASDQYKTGIANADQFRDEVAGSTEIRALRVVSDFFMWLAQIQTLIRLFPRYKEKMIIKWIGFLLILLDISFSCMNSFWIQSRITNPRDYTDAIPALAYLFQLALSLLYATWVSYYALTKASYAFYHHSMPSISIIAMLSIISLLIPVVFFIADVALYDVAAWGDYFRWVGALASSIVVWEWVERIEAVEKEEKKDGILGREIFEGDEGIDGGTSFTNSNSRGRHRGGSRSDSNAPANSLFGFRKAAGLLQRHVVKRRQLIPSQDSEKQPDFSQAQLGRVEEQTPPAATQAPVTQHEAPLPSSTPIDRNNTASAGSTVYAVRYHPASDSPAVRGVMPPAVGAEASQRNSTHVYFGDAADGILSKPQSSRGSVRRRGPIKYQVSRPLRTLTTFPFRKIRKSPPIEVKKAISSTIEGGNVDVDGSGAAKGVFGRLTNLADQHLSARWHSTQKGGQSGQQPTVIPAPTRGHTWSPDMLRSAQHQDETTAVGRSTLRAGEAAEDSNETNKDDEAEPIRSRVESPSDAEEANDHDTPAPNHSTNAEASATAREAPNTHAAENSEASEAVRRNSEIA